MPTSRRSRSEPQGLKKKQEGGVAVLTEASDGTSPSQKSPASSA